MSDIQIANLPALDQEILLQTQILRDMQTELAGFKGEIGGLSGHARAVFDELIKKQVILAITAATENQIKVWRQTHDESINNAKKVAVSLTSAVAVFFFTLGFLVAKKFVV